MKDLFLGSIVRPLQQLWKRPLFRIAVLAGLIPSVIALVTQCASSGGAPSQHAAYIQQSAPQAPTQPGQTPSLIRYAKSLFAPRDRTTSRSIGGQRPNPPAPEIPPAGGSMGFPIYGDEIPHIEPTAGDSQ